jgi:uncharacterized protein YgiB involved in biofilm formation
MSAEKSGNNDSKACTCSVEAVDKWMNKGSKTSRTIKSLSAVAFAGALIGGIVLHETEENNQGAQDVINALNTQETIVFNSHQDCVSKGYEAQLCAASQENAIDLASHFRSPVEASDFKSCIEKYGTCPLRSEKYSGGHKLELYEYSPVLSSWQAVKSDITQSALLYKTAKPSTYLRIDDTEITAPTL